MLPEAETLALIKELADDLEASIRAEYGMKNGQKSLYPTQQRRFTRDMDPVDRARAFLAQHKKG